MIGSDFPSGSQDGCLIPSITAIFKAGHSVEGAETRDACLFYQDSGAVVEAPSPYPPWFCLTGQDCFTLVPGKMRIYFLRCPWGPLTE